MKSTLAGMGIALTHGQALEAVAQQYGLDNWDTAVGVLNKPAPPVRAPRLSDMTCTPSDIWIESDNPVAKKYFVGDYGVEALDLLRDEVALRCFLASSPDEYNEGMDSNAIYLQGDGYDVYITFNELLGLEYVNLGSGSWKMSNGTYLRFCCDDIWYPEMVTDENSTELFVPETVK